MANQLESMLANHVLGELVRTSKSITIWIVGGQAPISIWPATDFYLGTLTLGSTVLAGFHMRVACKRIWVNIGTISRIDADPLPARENTAGQATTPTAPVQVE